MRVLNRSHDGGPNSGVTGYFLIEVKSLFSIVLLKFEPNHRENYHSHAFNAYTWWLSSLIKEWMFDDGGSPYALYWYPSIKPKYTPRENTHKIKVESTAWALSIRGPWHDTWTEVTPQGEVITLTHGRKVL